MKDIIDKKNERERMGRSIIKYWNVNYMAVPDNSMTIQQEQEMGGVVQEDEPEPKLTEALYNEYTKSYSGAYGSRAVNDEVTQGQIDKILQEKRIALRQLIEDNSQES